MKTYDMNLQPAFFDYVKNGTKRIELRLNDEKRQQIKVGDQILFNTDAGDLYLTEVIALHYADNFTELFEKFSIEELADKTWTKEALLTELEKFYTKEKQAKYGVVGIEVKEVKEVK